MNHRTKKILSYVLSLAVVAVAAVWVASRFICLGHVEYTDNAQIQRRVVPVNSRVQGYIKEICFSEYEPVKKGDTLIIIDDADLQLQVARARADYATALAGRSVASRAVTSASANVAVSEATIVEAQAQMELAAMDLERYRNLLAKDAVTRREYDAAATDYKARKARYDMLVSQRGATSTVVDVNRERKSQSEAAIDVAEAMLRTAELNLSYTVILAPCDGYTSRKNIQPGQLVQPGQTLLDLVDSDEVWVTANFKETQLQHIAPGSEVDIEVDAIPGSVYHGVVQSISTATGAALSLMPQDNSAGNFVKVRQRVPVRIEFSPEYTPRELACLRAGLNVECRVKY